MHMFLYVYTYKYIYIHKLKDIIPDFMILGKCFYVFKK